VLRGSPPPWLRKAMARTDETMDLADDRVR